MINDTNIQLVESDSKETLGKLFADSFKLQNFGIRKTSVDILKSGPDHPDYFEVWDEVLNKTHEIPGSGVKMNLSVDKMVTQTSNDDCVFIDHASYQLIAREA